MTEVTNYQCDICGEIYFKQEDADKCESFHIKPAEAEALSFGSMTKTNIPYPASIIMKMEDGAVVRYVYHEILNVPKPEEGEFNVPVAGDDQNADPVGCGCDEVDEE